jgi:hypothetical protein
MCFFAHPTLHVLRPNGLTLMRPSVVVLAPLVMLRRLVLVVLTHPLVGPTFFERPLATSISVAVQGRSTFVLLSVKPMVQAMQSWPVAQYVQGGCFGKPCFGFSYSDVSLGWLLRASKPYVCGATWLPFPTCLRRFYREVVEKWLHTRWAATTLRQSLFYSKGAKLRQAQQ